jgi:hypothetical protein
MKTLIATFTLALVISTSAIAKTEKKSATFGAARNSVTVAPRNSVTVNNSITCGRFVLADPDPAIRAQLVRDCPNYHQGAD